MTPLAQALALAVKHHEAGRFLQAEELYQQILKLDPRQVEALHLMGMLSMQLGNNKHAEAYMRQAIRLKPDHAKAHYHLGMVLREQRKLDEAVGSFQEALRFNPGLSEAHNNLGNVFKELGKLEEAVRCLRQALRLKPENAQTLNNLGVVLQEQGKLEEALAYFREAIRLQPDLAEAHSSLGMSLRMQGHLDEAISCFQQAVRLKPQFAETHNELGVALQEKGKLDEAIASLKQAIQLKPIFAEAHNNLGIVFQEQGKLDKALECYQQAIQGKTIFPKALGNIIRQLQHMCLWKGLTDITGRLISTVLSPDEPMPAPAASPFTFLTLTSPPTTAKQQLLCAEKYAEECIQAVKRFGDQAIAKHPHQGSGRIKLGYLSADFSAHATAVLIAELFERHDRKRFEVFGYSYGPEDHGAMRERLVKGLDRFVDIREDSPIKAAQRIADDGIDILIDLKGYIKGCRPEILALRPAPIQVNYLGYPGTMGAPFMDYIVVDDYVVPTDQQPFFSEHLVRLPGCYQVNDSRREIDSVTPSRTSCGLPAQGFVFCAFNYTYKITPEMFSIWMQLLKAVPGSVLWLLESNPFAPKNLTREAEARGISAKRLLFAPILPLAQHLARIRLADLFLDSFPVNGHTTVSDALWAGCPVLTLAGETFVARVAGSLLRTVGVPELIASSFEEYQALALRLAREPDLLAILRTKLSEGRKNSRLFDTERFARNLEKAYETMWETHLSGASPHPFAVREA